jgi:hypothetical protein
MSRRRRPSRHASTDVAGRDVRVGDWVRVMRVPDSISRLPRATKQAFSRAVGKTFQIEAFDELGCAELDLSGKVGFDTIWIEPFCVQRFRRPKKQSPRFRKTLAIRRRLDRPRWSLRYVAKYRRDDNPDRMVEQLQRCSLGHGWYVLKDRTEIHETFYGQDKTLSSKRRLEQLRSELRENHLFLSLRFGSIRLST